MPHWRLVFSQCSSVGEVADAANLVLPVPVVRIDEVMAKEAIRLGPRIKILATLRSTLGPSERLIARLAANEGRSVDLESHLVEEAFEAFRSGDAPTHDRLVGEALRKAAIGADVLICAQGSMASALDGGSDLGVPVLTSLELGIRDVARRLGVEAQA